MILGDFNVGTEDYYMKLFCENYNLKSLIKQPTCYKNPDNPTCIDLILTNVPRSFQSIFFLETGLSNFHLMTLSVVKKRFKKFQSRIIQYRSYKNFSNKYFRKCLLEKLSKEVLVNNDDGFQKFCDINITALNEHAPLKKKVCSRESNAFFEERFIESTNDESRLRSTFLNNKTEEKKELLCFTFKKYLKNVLL